MSQDLSSAARDALLFVQRYLRGNYDNPIDGVIATKLAQHYSEFGFSSPAKFLDALRDAPFTTLVNGLIYRDGLSSICPDAEPCPECPECPECPDAEPCPECPECPEIGGGLITLTHLGDFFVLNFGGAGGNIGATELEFPNAVDSGPSLTISYLNDVVAIRMPLFETVFNGNLVIDELPLMTTLEIPKIVIDGGTGGTIQIQNSAALTTVDMSSMTWIGTGGQLAIQNVALSVSSVNSILVRAATFIGIAFAGSIDLSGGTSAAPTGAGAAAATALTTAGWTIVTN